MKNFNREWTRISTNGERRNQQQPARLYIRDHSRSFAVGLQKHPKNAGFALCFLPFGISFVATSEALSQAVSLHPYFRIREGNLEAFTALMPAFTRNGDMAFCREAYIGAEGVLAHLGNVGELLGKFLELSDLARLEVHGEGSFGFCWGKLGMDKFVMLFIRTIRAFFSASDF